MEGQFGVETIKQAARVGVSIAMKVEQAGKDGFQVTDLFQFVGDLAQIPAIVENKQALLDEFGELSPIEVDEVVKYVQTELTLENKGLEEAIEAGLSLVVSIIVAIDKVKAVTKKSTPPIQ